MMRGIVTVGTLLSVIFFPWPVTAVFALLASLSEPLVPLAAGIFIDTLHYVPGQGEWPLSTMLGAIVTVLVFFVRGRLKAGNIGE